jgi:hypothetical protein
VGFGADCELLSAFAPAIVARGVDDVVECEFGGNAKYPSLAFCEDVIGAETEEEEKLEAEEPNLNIIKLGPFVVRGKT